MESDNSSSGAEPGELLPRSSRWRKEIWQPWNEVDLGPGNVRQRKVLYRDGERGESSGRTKCNGSFLSSPFFLSSVVIRT